MYRVLHLPAERLSKYAQMCVWSLLQGRNSWIVSWTRVRSWSPRTVLPLNYQGRKLVGGHKRYNGGESLCTWRGLPKVFWGLLAFRKDWGEVNTPTIMARANNLKLFFFYLLKMYGVCQETRREVLLGLPCHVLLLPPSQVQATCTCEEVLGCSWFIPWVAFGSFQCSG